jgi:hypothetical protein
MTSVAPSPPRRQTVPWIFKEGKDSPHWKNETRYSAHLLTSVFGILKLGNAPGVYHAILPRNVSKLLKSIT